MRVAEKISEQILFYRIGESISRIEKNPRQYKVIHKNVHRALVRRFPSGIYYVLIDSSIAIIAVLHARTRNIGRHAHNK